MRPHDAGAGGAAVLGAITGVATGAIAAAKKALDSHSPSKVFMGIGGDTSEGMAIGVDDGASDVQSSMEAMVSPPSVGAMPAAASTTGGAGSGTTVTVGSLTFNIEAGGSATEIASACREAFDSYISAAVAQVGGAVAA